MDELKMTLRKDGRIIGLFILAHQLFFNLLCAVLLIASGLVLTILEVPELEDTNMYIASDAAMLISGIFFLIFWLVNRQRLKESRPEHGQCSPKLLLICFAIILGSNAVLSMLDILFNAITGLSLSIPVEQNPQINPLVLFLTVGVFPAIMEEILFRGILYRYLRNYDSVFASVASSLIFGLIHQNVLQFLFGFVLGMVLCHVYERTGKLYHAMLLHFLNNSLVVLVNLLLVDRKTVNITECIIGAVTVIITVLYAVRMKRSHKKIITRDMAELKIKCRFFFTSVPMMIFTLLFAAICLLIIFI